MSLSCLRLAPPAFSLRLHASPSLREGEDEIPRYARNDMGRECVAGFGVVGVVFAHVCDDHVAGKRDV